MYRRFLLVALAAVGAAIPSVHAQIVIVRGGSTLRVQVAPGGQVAVPIVIDMSGGEGMNISSLTLGMAWGAGRLSFDSVKTGTFGSLTSNTGGAAGGSISMSAFDASGTTSTVTMATAYFTAAATSGGTRVEFTPTVAGDDVGNDVLPLLGVHGLDVCVATTGLWGDVNGSASVNIIDAQQIARFSVGLSVANPAAVSSQGDVTADNNVNIIDAQQIARFSVALSAAPRVNTALFVPPAVAAVVLSESAASVNMGSSLFLTGDLYGAGETPVNGCAPLAWSTSNAEIASVDSAGRVVGMGPGTATITVTAGGQTDQALITVVAAGAADSILVVAGDQQWGILNSQVPVAPQVIVKDSANNPVPNVAVTFTASGGTFNSGSPAIINTDVNGRATAPLWIMPTTGTTAVMTASVGESVTSVTMTVNLVPQALGQTMCMYDLWGNRCWGNGTRGQLGNGASASSTTPVNVTVGSSNMRLTSSSIYGDHVCSLDSSGAAFCWGSNAAGQLGDGTRTDRNTPTAVAGSHAFQSLAMGLRHTCGVTTAGDVYCWGLGSFGQLGDGTVGSSEPDPVQVLAPEGVVFTQVSAGYNHTCAANAAGDVYCWGDNRFGQLGDGTITTMPRSSPEQVTGITSVTQLSSNANGTCGLTAAGSVHCWGSNTSGQLGNGGLTNSAVPAAVQGAHVFSRISSGFGRSCGEKHQGSEFTVWCWGLNGGSLGDGSTLDRSAPTLIPHTMQTVTHGSGSSCGRGIGGSQVFCWGTNAAGQVGDGTTTARPAPTLVARAGASPGAPVAMRAQSIAMLPQSAAAGTAVPLSPSVVVLDGLGNPVSGATVTWTVSGGGTVGAATATSDAGGIAASGGWTLGATAGAQMLQASVAGVIVNGDAAPPLRTTFVAYGTNTPAGAAKISGDSTYSGQSNGGSIAVPLVVKVVDGSNGPIANAAVTFVLGASSGSFSGGGTSATVLTDANGLATIGGTTWFPNTNAGAQSTVTATVSGLASPLVFTHFRAAGGFGLATCELTAAGTAMCLGTNTYGSVGDGTTTNRTTFVPVTGGAVFSSLAEGSSMTKCGLVGTAAFCWGSNSMGQLGDGTQIDRLVPTPVTGGLAFSRLVSQGFTTCGLTTSNQLYCWGFTGDNGWGLGEAMRGRIKLVPTLVNTGGLTFTKIAVSDNGMCGLTAAGTIHCRGRGLNGDGTSAIGTAFVQWPGEPWMDIAAGNIMACALDTAGLAYCQGGSGQGGMGTGSTTSTFVPTQVLGGVSFSSIHVGNFRACARRANAELYCWGINNGVGTTSAIDGPAILPGLQAASVRIGHFRNACAKATNGQLYCWGPNSGTASSGTVGDGTTIDRLTPVAIPNWPDGPAAGTAVAMYTNTGAYSSIVSATVSPTPSVTLRDRLGAPVAGVAVTFAADAGNGVVAGGSAVTDAAGVATVGSWTLPATVGTARLVVSAPGVPNAVFSATVQTPPASITIGSGNNQYLPDFYTSANALTVTVLDANNAPISGMGVTYAVTAGNGTVGGTSSVIFTTNASGVASATSWSPPSAIGTPYTITASVPGLAPVTFTARRMSWGSNGTSNPTSAQCRLNSSGAAFCWGGNAQGQVGDGTNTNRSTPVAVSGGITFASLARASLGFHQCGLTSSGQAYCWGSNEAGQLGNNTQTASNVPVLVPGGLTFSSLATGPLSTCGLATNGLMYCWGWGAFSHRGDGEINTIRTVPTLVNTGGNTFVNFAIGGRVLCALDAAGQAFCWGESFSGNLGLGSTNTAATAQATQTALRFTQLTSGYDFACGVTTSSTVACWGSNFGGQIGNGTTTNQTTPAALALAGVSEVRAGEVFACSRAPAAVHCWGQNSSGQIGDGTQGVNRTSPMLVAKGIVPAALPTFARNLSCVSTSSQLYCWGSGSAGIGDGTGNLRTVPTAVQWPESSPANAANLAPSTPLVIAAPAGAPQTVIVQVKNAFGSVMSGVTVLFDVISGGGTVSAASGITDASGNASVSWTLAGGAGTVGTMDVRVSGVPTLVFTGTVGSAAGSMVITSGDNQYVPDFQSPTALSVTVLDVSSAPVAGATVTWTVGAGSGSISTTATNTNASGIATLPQGSWSPPTAVGVAYTVQASVAGPPPVTFTARRLGWGSNGANNPTHAICRLNSSGAALCWGGNNQGAVGDGTNTNRQAPTAVSGGLTFTSLAKGAHGNHNCGLTSAGQAFCWGNNDAGQLGNNSQANSNVPTPVAGGLAFSSLATGPVSTCGLTTAGAMYCWGWGSWSFRGDGELFTIRTVPTLVNTGGRTFTSLAVGLRQVCGLDSAGQAFCWGENGGGQLGTGNFTSATTSVATSTALRFTSLASGFDHVCGLTTGATAACWGSNGSGNVGNGTTSNQNTPLVVGGLAGVLEVRGGESHYCARTSTSVHCWGNNGSSQVGDGTNTSPRTTPVLVTDGFTPGTLLSFARTVSCVTSNTQMYCWGNMNAGLGDGTFTSPRALANAVSWPEASTLNPGTTYALTPQFITAAAASPQTVTIQVKNAFGTVMPNVAVNFVVTSGGGTVSVASVTTDTTGRASTAWSLAGAVGVVGKMEARVSNIPTLVFTGTVTAGAGSMLITGGNNQHVPDFFQQVNGLAVTVRDASNNPMVGTTVTWTVTSGNGTISTTAINTGAGGIASLNGWITPTAPGTAYTLQASVTGVAPVTFTSKRLAWNVGGSLNPVSSICRLTTAGLARCWGGNALGAVGDGTVINRTLPTAVSGGQTYASLASGAFGYHNCALTSGGQAHCWGNNDAGQLGNNSQVNSTVPVPVSGGLAFASLGTGPLSTCGLTSGGALYCWGWGSYSHRGDGEFYTVRTVPTLVNTGGRTFTSFAVGLRALCAIDGAGQAFCVGENFGGQLGDGTTTHATLPVATSTALRFTSLSVGFDHTCGLTTAATSNVVACWGINASGAVGNGTTTNQLTPAPISGITNVIDVRAGESHNCLRTTAGSVHCWGANGAGQVGDATFTSPRTSPLLVASGLTPTSVISFSRSASCATSSTQMYCWGTTNSAGGIGDGTGNSRNVATAVQWPDASPSDVAMIAAVTSSNFSAAAGSPQMVTVQVRNSVGQSAPLNAVAVNFVVISGGGSVSVASGTTSGTISTNWTLAGPSGTVGKLEVRVAGIPSLVITGTVP